MATGEGVVVVAVEEQTLGVAPALGRVFPEAHGGVVGPAQECEFLFQRIEYLGVLPPGAEGAGAADVDAFQAAAALPGVDVHGVEAAGAGRGLFHGAEEGFGLGHREDGEGLDHGLEAALEGGVFEIELGDRRPGDFVEGGGVLAG